MTREEIIEEHNLYNEILAELYSIKSITKNKKLNNYISYVKGVKRGLELAIETNYFQG